MKTSLKPTLAGTFVIALSIILFEIALTRVFAIMMWHHFTYMVVSIGLLGFGAAGSILTARREGLKTGSPAQSLTLFSFLYGGSVMVAFFVATSVPIDSLAIWQEKANFLALMLIYTIISVPFLLGGLVIGMVLTRYVAHVNRLYFFDLVGSAVGAGISVVLLKSFGSTATVILAGSFGMLAAFLFSLGAPRRWLLFTVPGLLLAALIAISFTGGSAGLGIPASTWHVPFAPGKEGALVPDTWELDRIPSATAEVEVSPSVTAPPTLGGDVAQRDLAQVPLRAVAQDGTAPTLLFRDSVDIDSFPFLRATQAGSAFVALEARGTTAPKVLVIGVGGGIDVMIALAYNAQRITAVEINTAMIEMVRERYDDYIGGLFRPGGHPRADRIELIHGEGRSYLRNTDTRHDIIQMSGVDSYTALSTGAYTLSESYLYTTGAVKDFYAHLEDGGIVSYSRWIMSRPRKPRESLRLANIAYVALGELGIEDPAAHIAVFQGSKWASTMIKRGPFLPVEIQALRAFARRMGFVGMVFDPLWQQGAQIEPEPSHLNSLRNGMFELAGASGLFGTEETAVESVVDHLTAGFIRIARGEQVADALLPAELEGVENRAWALDVLDTYAAAAIGAARSAIDTQKDFVQLLRSPPEARDRFIADYEYDISAVTDDMPFFFNYYRYSNLLSGGRKKIHDPTHFRYQTDFPVGHLVLLGSLLQIIVLAALLIFLPLRKLAREGLRTPGVGRYFAYFTALGIGFMFVEITLMQKMVIFLGHPTYAMSVVLAGLLGFAGLGSYLAGRIQTITKAHLNKILLGVTIVILLDAVAVNTILPVLLGQSLTVRIAAVLMVLLPTGLALGMLFPTGMRILKAQCPQLLPWAWAVNAFCSVFASILCVVLSMGIGFTNVLLVALGVYVLGVLPMRVLPARDVAASRESS